MAITSHAEMGYTDRARAIAEAVLRERRVPLPADLKELRKRDAGAAHAPPKTNSRTSQSSQCTGAYCDCNAFAGLTRAARAAGIVVARNVIAVISSVAIARITGSEARIAYTRLEMTWPEK